MQAKLIVLMALTLATGCQTCRDGILTCTPPRFPKAFGFARASETCESPVGSTEDLPFAQARALEKKGELARAEGLYQRALEENPRHALAAHRLAVIADRRGKFEQSAWYFEKGLFVEPDNADIRCDYGYSLYTQRKWQEAAAQYQSALAIDPKHQRTHNNFGLLLARTGRPNEALAAFRSAGCGSTEARMNLAFILTMEGQPKLAQQQLEEARQTVAVSSTMRERMDELQQWIGEAMAEAPDGPRDPTLARRPQPPANQPVSNISHRRHPSGVHGESPHASQNANSSLR